MKTHLEAFITSTRRRLDEAKEPSATTDPLIAVPQVEQGYGAITENKTRPRHRTNVHSFTKYQTSPDGSTKPIKLGTYAVMAHNNHIDSKSSWETNPAPLPGYPVGRSTTIVHKDAAQPFIDGYAHRHSAAKPSAERHDAAVYASTLDASKHAPDADLINGKPYDHSDNFFYAPKSLMAQAEKDTGSQIHAAHQFTLANKNGASPEAFLNDHKGVATDLGAEVVSLERKKVNAEVYTRQVHVRAMIELIASEYPDALRGNVLEPTAGKGAFLYGVIHYKVHDLGMSPLDALRTTFGTEIQVDNVAHARRSALYAAFGDKADLTIIEGELVGKPAKSLRFQKNGTSARDKELLEAYEIVNKNIRGGVSFDYLTPKLDGQVVHLPQASHFSLVIGNPPYQKMTVGGSTSAPPLYQDFLLQAKYDNADVVCYIIPARWLSATQKELANMRSYIASRKSHIIDFGAQDVFPSVKIKGGVSVILVNNKELENHKVSVQSRTEDVKADPARMDDQGQRKIVSNLHTDPSTPTVNPTMTASGEQVKSVLVVSGNTAIPSSKEELLMRQAMGELASEPGRDVINKIAMKTKAPEIRKLVADLLKMTEQDVKLLSHKGKERFGAFRRRTRANVNFEVPTKVGVETLTVPIASAFPVHGIGAPSMLIIPANDSTQAKLLAQGMAASLNTPIVNSTTSSRAVTISTTAYKGIPCINLTEAAKLGAAHFVNIDTVDGIKGTVFDSKLGDTASIQAKLNTQTIDEIDKKITTAATEASLHYNKDWLVKAAQIAEVALREALRSTTVAQHNMDLFSDEAINAFIKSASKRK